MIDTNHVCEIFCIFKELKNIFNHYVITYPILEQQVDDWYIQTNFRSTTLIWVQSEDEPASCIFGGEKFFKNQIAKKVLRSAKPPLDICYSNTQNAFLNYLNCAQVCAIFVFHINIWFIKKYFNTNIQFKNNNGKYPPKNLKICLQIN